MGWPPRDEEALASALADLAGAVAFPPTPSIAAAVGSQVRTLRARRRAWPLPWVGWTLARRAGGHRVPGHGRPSSLGEDAVRRHDRAAHPGEWPDGALDLRRRAHLLLSRRQRKARRLEPAPGGTHPDLAAERAGAARRGRAQPLRGRGGGQLAALVPRVA